VPTLAEVAGVKVAHAVDGVSILPVLKETGAVQREAIYWHYPHYANQGSRPGGAVRAGKWKLIEHYEDGKVELFDLAEDASEARDLAAANAEQARKLRSMLEDWRRSVDAQMPRRKG
jgi:arylsulfatase A-like enzyme